MNRKDILHAPDIEDANYIEEDYLDKDDRKKYESDIRDYENKLFHKSEKKPDLFISKEGQQSKKDLDEKVESTVNDAALLL